MSGWAALTLVVLVVGWFRVRGGQRRKVAKRPEALPAGVVVLADRDRRCERLYRYGGSGGRM